jgi:hypothetical protein
MKTTGGLENGDLQSLFPRGSHVTAIRHGHRPSISIVSDQLHNRFQFVPMMITFAVPDPHIP